MPENFPQAGTIVSRGEAVSTPFDPALNLAARAAELEARARAEIDSEAAKLWPSEMETR